MAQTKFQTFKVKPYRAFTTYASAVSGVVGIGNVKGLGATRARKGKELEENQPRASKTVWTLKSVREPLKKVLIESDITPYLWGPPGLGKSSLIRQLAQELKWDLIDLRLSQINPVDLRGLPVVDRKKELAKWLKPDFLPRENGKPGILFLDELNLAAPSIQAASYELILDRRVGNYKFPSSWKIIAAGNREHEASNVFKLSAPLANRFIHFEIQPDLDSWNEWALDNSIDMRIVKFLTARPRFLYSKPHDGQKSFPSPRSWEFTSSLIRDIEEPILLERLTASAIGDSVAKEFISTLVNGEKTAEVETLVKQIQKGESFVLPQKPSERVAIMEAVADIKMPLRSIKSLLDQLSKEEQVVWWEKVKESGEKTGIW